MAAVATFPTQLGQVSSNRPAPEPGRCVLLDGIDWPTYEAIGTALLNRANIRLTYDRGSLEIMTLSPEHERLRVLFGHLVQVLAEEANIPMAGFGSTTYKSDVLEKGLEPDQCYYHANYARVRGLRRIDLSRDPPPDLAVEIDVTRSSLNRMAIYERLGVPELWRFDGERLHVYRRNATGVYEPCAASSTFPAIPLGELVRFLRLGLDQDDTSVVRAFRAWVQERLSNP
jgi:Uma2 family endonuclease